MYRPMDWIRRNFGLKVAAVVIAVGLWFTFNYLTATQAYTKTLEIPLALHGVAAGLVAASNVREVTVELAGPRSQLERLGPGDFQAFVDCGGKREGTAALNVAVVGSDSEKIRSVSPAAVVVALDQYAYRRVPVVASGSAQNSSAADIDPKSVIVAGGQTMVSRVMAAQVNIDAASASKPVTVTLKPVPVDGNLAMVAGLTVAPASVRVAIVPRKVHS